MAAAIFLAAVASPAYAFKLFGMTFFGSKDEEVAVVPDAQPYTLTFNVTGADKDLTRAIENASALSRDKDRPPPGTAGLIARGRGDYGRIVAALYSQGQYGGVVRITVQGAPIEGLRPDIDLPDPVDVAVDVNVGPLFRFGDIRIDGLPAEPITREDRRALNLDHWDFKEGAEARSGYILDTEGRITEVWRQRGYPKAGVPTREIVADHATNTVDVHLAVAPGPAAQLGTVTVTGTDRMDAEFTRWMTGIRPGEPYDPDTVKRARDRLLRLGVFSSVSVVEAETVGPDGVLPLTFNVAERKRRLIGGGASYSTLEGAALQAYWLHRNLFGKAESLRFDAALTHIGTQDFGGLNYSAAVTFKKPGVFTPDTDMTLQVWGKREYLDTYESRSVGAKVGLEHQFTENLRGSTALNFEKAYVEDALGNHQYTIVSLPSTLDYDGRDNKLDPTEGWRALVNAEPFVDLRGETAALIGTGSLSTYRSFGERDRMIVAVRGALGSIVGADELEDIPATRRFFLGGGGSIRGYEYRSVGPSINGEVVGGLSFWEASAELRFRLTETIGVVPFVDAGAAYEDAVPDFSENVKVGAGIGLRYYTSLGPIRLDVATPLNPDDGDPSVAFYVGLGQAF